MALIRYLKNAPGAKAGAIRDVEGRYAKPLVDLLFAEYYTRQIEAPDPARPAVVPDPPATAVPSEEAAPKKKRQYKRRDLKAEE